MEFPRIHEYFEAAQVPPEHMDTLWAEGWRHFGALFVRYSTREEEQTRRVQPLRVRVQEFCPSKSQRRVMQRNVDLRLRVQPTVIDDERRRLFEAHARRFTENVPESIEEFLGQQPASVPCVNMELALYAGDRLVAASYLDLGRLAVSSVYAMFDPAESKRGLGTCTALWEIQYARERRSRYYYPGYAYHESSALDYKKSFRPAEWFDWKGSWHPLEPV